MTESTSENNLADRRLRGFAILAQADTIRQATVNTFKVRSQSGNGEYVVTNGVEWDCTCPDHVWRKLECKHIWSVRSYLGFLERQNENDSFEIVKEVIQAPTCRFCGSGSIFKRGVRKNKSGSVTRYSCNKCGRWFVIDEGFAKMRHDGKIIALALDLYFRGFSARKIVEHLDQFYGIKIHHKTVFNWIAKYVPRVSEYMDWRRPRVGKVWLVDELKAKNHEGWKWIWNAEDHETRYLLATHVSTQRNTWNAEKTFRKAKQVAVYEPSVVVTDQLGSYVEAYNNVFRHGRKSDTAHFRMGLRGSLSNNRCERLHGSIREREKIMRAMKTERTAQLLMDGYRVHYNMVRKHQALNQTPSQAAEIGIEANNKWLELIRQSVKK